MTNEPLELDSDDRILIVGHGRVASALVRTLQHKNHNSNHSHIKLRQISGRSTRTDLLESASWATHIWLAVSDSAIAQLANALLGCSARLVHFAASVSVVGVAKWHPLAAFGIDTPRAENFDQILFVGEQGQDFSKDMPGLANAVFTLEPDNFVRYHALCFLGVGLPMGPMKHAFSELKKFGISESHLKSFFSSAFEAFLYHPDAPTSGPHTRNDIATLNAHQSVLPQASLQWYRSLMKGAQL